MNFAAIVLVGPFLGKKDRHSARAVSHEWRDAMEQLPWMGARCPQLPRDHTCSACSKACTVVYNRGYICPSWPYVDERDWLQLEPSVGYLHTLRVLGGSVRGGSLAGLHNLKALELGSINQPLLVREYVLHRPRVS